MDFGSGVQSYLVEFKALVRYHIYGAFAGSWMEVWGSPVKVGEESVWLLNGGGPENLVNKEC